MSKIYCPEDLVLNILSRLPVKSLLRFRCVSKSWRLMIDSPSFITTHIKQSRIAKSPMKLIVGGKSFEVNKLYSDNFSFPESSNTKNIEVINYPIIYEEPAPGNNNITFVGSCNGLVCLVYSPFELDIVLWNPSTGKYRRLPQCSKQFGIVKVVYSCSHGFGYDELNDDYKVFRLVKYCKDDNISRFFVYSLKSNEWRCLEDFPFKNDIGSLFFHGILANGTLHWIFDNHSILASDVATERSQLLPLPDTSFIDPTLCTLVLGGCQRLICFDRSSRGREMWVMEDNGIKGSWTKLTFDLAINKKLLMFTHSTFAKETIVLFNLERQWSELVNFPIKGKNPTMCFYFESLVRLDAVGRNDATLGDSRKRKKIWDGKNRKLWIANIALNIILALIAYWKK